MKKQLPSFLESEVSASSPEQSMFHIIPVPFEKSVTYGTGTRNGPYAILEASLQLEVYDGFSCPCEKGIYTWEALNSTGDFLEVFDSISDSVKKVISFGNNHIPILLGGEHSISYGAIKSLKDSGNNIGVIQFDAHADLRESYRNSKWNHACVMKRVIDLDIPVLQLGVRAVSPEELETRGRFKSLITYIDGYELGTSGIKQGPLLPENFPENVYVTIDVDGLDPSIMPATGTPVPGGLGWYQAQELLRRISLERKIIGADIVELAPIDGLHSCNFSASSLVYNLMGFIQRSGFYG